MIYTVEVTSRSKELVLVDRVPEEVWTEVHNIVQESVAKIIPKKKMQEGKVFVWGGFTNSWRKNRSEKQGKKGKISEFQRIARRDKKAFFSEQCKEIEKNNRMGKTTDLFKKIRAI